MRDYINTTSLVVGLYDELVPTLYSGTIAGCSYGLCHGDFRINA